MAGSSSFKFEGGREIEAALAELGKPALIRRTADRGLRAAAEPIRDEWVRLAPEQEGDLKNAIKIGKAIRAYQRRGNSGDLVTTFVGIDESVNARLHIYAEVEEFGNETHAAQPAGRPAFESRKQAAADRLADDLRAMIEDVARRAERKTARLAKKSAKL
jgi:HK97 gp10 family phage protein